MMMMMMMMDDGDDDDDDDGGGGGGWQQRVDTLPIPMTKDELVKESEHREKALKEALEKQVMVVVIVVVVIVVVVVVVVARGTKRTRGAITAGPRLLASCKLSM